MKNILNILNYGTYHMVLVESRFNVNTHDHARETAIKMYHYRRFANLLTMYTLFVLKH